MTERERARLAVFRCYHTYVLVLHESSMQENEAAVRQARAALAAAIEQACVIDPALLGDFKRSFGSRPRR